MTRKLYYLENIFIQHNFWNDSVPFKTVYSYHDIVSYVMSALHNSWRHIALWIWNIQIAGIFAENILQPRQEELPLLWTVYGIKNCQIISNKGCLKRKDAWNLAATHYVKWPPKLCEYRTLQKLQIFGMKRDKTVLEYTLSF